MAYKKLLSPADILNTAVQMVESSGADGVSLRAVASALGVKAPSLYRYFPDKGALESAVAEEALRAVVAALQRAATIADAEARFRATAEAYLHFARERFALYTFIMERVPLTHGMAASKAVWNLLLKAASDVSGRPDDTAAAVATWSFLHGYVLRLSGRSQLTTAAFVRIHNLTESGHRSGQLARSYRVSCHRMAGSY